MLKPASLAFVVVYALLRFFPQILQYKAFILAACILLLQYWPVWKDPDPYGLFHLSLNRLPGAQVDHPPGTEWLNMGYWKDTSLFPKACEALARETIEATRMKAGARVLDVGYGTGESIVTLLSHPSVPKPSAITGITSLAIQHRRAQHRVTSLLQSMTFTTTKPLVNLQEGDAIYNGNQSNHPLDPSTPETYDAILAIDCAYHFNTREKFLIQTFRKLSPGGRIALTDICLDFQAVHGFWRKAFLSIARLMPKRNMVSIGEYKTQMVKAGYIDIEVREITHDVFPPFIAFLEGQGLVWKCLAHVLRGYVSSGAKFVVASGSKPQT